VAIPGIPASGSCGNSRDCFVTSFLAMTSEQ
jgi:hypothetical protein